MHPRCSTVFRASRFRISKFSLRLHRQRQLVLSVERDLVSYDKLEEFPRSLRFITYDCGQAALEAKGMENFRKNGLEKFQKKVKYETFQNALAFRTKLLPYINSVVDAQRKKE